MSPLLIMQSIYMNVKGCNTRACTVCTQHIYINILGITPYRHIAFNIVWARKPMSHASYYHSICLLITRLQLIYIYPLFDNIFPIASYKFSQINNISSRYFEDMATDNLIFIGDQRCVVVCNKPSEFSFMVLRWIVLVSHRILETYQINHIHMVHSKDMDIFMRLQSYLYDFTKACDSHLLNNKLFHSE